MSVSHGRFGTDLKYEGSSGLLKMQAYCGYTIASLKSHSDKQRSLGNMRIVLSGSSTPLFLVASSAS